jgi:hypothetical protein
MTDLKITVRCIGCKAEKVVGPEQVEQPVCQNCWLPMVAESARND